MELMFSVPTPRRLITAAAATVLLAGCSSASTSDDGPDPAADETETHTLRIAAVQSPMTDVVEAAGEAIEDGYEIELVEYPTTSPRTSSSTTATLMATSPNTSPTWKRSTRGTTPPSS